MKNLYNYRKNQILKEVEMIEIEPLASGQYLLGFSGGVDSSALFFLLLESKVDFDIAIVDYGVREQSKEEVAYAQSLAKQYNKTCFHIQAPRFQSNFEAQAREFRYKFFSTIIAKHHYKALLLAHQFDDRVEWMMMQFCKGAGLNTLLGYEYQSRYKEIEIFRPLLKVQKKELYEYCQNNQIVFFEDESNMEEKYKRNIFRKYLQPIISKHSKGMIQSFEYLFEERCRLYPSKEIGCFAGIEFWQKGEAMQDLHLLDLQIKKRGYILSAKQKEEILRCSFSCEIVDFVIESDFSKIFLCPKKEGKMSKEFRDFARKYKIPQRLRRILFFCGEKEEKILEFLKKNKIGN